MSTPSPDQQPTRVLPQQTAEEPVVSTAPATRRARIWAHVPARVGRARTSTLVIGCLFVLLMALNAALPRDEGTTTTVTDSNGRVFEIPSSYVPSVPTTPAPAPAPGTTPAPATTSAPARTSSTPQTSDAEPESTPSETTRAPSRSTSSSSAPSSSTRSSATSRAPSSTADPLDSAAPSDSSTAPSS